MKPIWEYNFIEAYRRHLNASNLFGFPASNPIKFFFWWRNKRSGK